MEEPPAGGLWSKPWHRAIRRPTEAWSFHRDDNMVTTVTGPVFYPGMLPNQCLVIVPLPYLLRHGLTEDKE